MSIMEHWYVFQSKPHKERQVADQLQRRRLDVFLPMARVSPVNPRAARERPYFPGYLFAKGDIETAGIGAVQWLPGLNRLVQFGGQPAAVADGFIAELRRRIADIRAAGGLMFDGLERGVQVRITSGPFAGYEAVFDVRLTGAERVRVLIEWIEHAHRRGRSGAGPRYVPVELNVSSIEKVRRKH